MLTVKNLTYYIGGRTLYDAISLQIKPQDKIGLVGRNGSGKSTLMQIIIGKMTPHHGSINHSKETTIGFFNQDLLSYQTDDSIRAVAMLAFKEAIVVQKKIDEVLHKMETNYRDELVEELGVLQDLFSQFNGYDMATKTDQLLEKMGFTTQDLGRPFSEFSGGWRMRVLFAKLLLQCPSLLLLDEPTNHLDIVSIQWIESYLKSYPNAFMIISHDRRFLDGTTNKTIELTQEKVHTYAGNYSFYEQEKAVRSVTQQSAYENQQKKLKKDQEFVDRFRAKSSKARSVQSRIKAMDRMEKIAVLTKDKTRLRIRFPMKETSGKQVVTLKNIAKAFGDLSLLESASANITRGDKIALIGVNGKGKSTLLNLIAGTLPIDTGTITLGNKVRLGFHAQHQLESLQLNDTIVETLRKTIPDEEESVVRSILGAFLFKKDDVHKLIKVLSGGEKARVSLAKTLACAPNFLLLDEPTNHLDMQAIEVLTQALQHYKGTLIFVSHDRHFIQSIANKMWYIEDKKIKAYPGTYDEYTYWQQKNRKG